MQIDFTKKIRQLIMEDALMVFMASMRDLLKGAFEASMLNKKKKKNLTLGNNLNVAQNFVMIILFLLLPVDHVLQPPQHWNIL